MDGLAARLPDLFLHFLLLSSISFGGISVVLPDMQRYVVEVNPWLTPKQFGDAFALGQAAPAPNVMFVTILGWLIAGWAGAFTTTLALFLPGGIAAVLLLRFNPGGATAKFGRAIRRGLSPVTVGLVLSSGWVLVSTANEDWRGYAVSLVTLALVLGTRLHPLLLIAAGAAAGIAGLV